MLHVRDAGRRTEPSPVLKLALTFLVFYLVVPGLTGQNAQAAAQTPAYQGYHDVSNCDGIYGWAWDANQPNAAINVDVYADNNLVATGTANQNRPDVAAAGFGTGYYGFSIPTPATLKDGQPHTISVRFAGTTTDLSTTPRQILCTPPQIVSYPDAKRLIEQSTFGPSPALIAHVRQVGFEAFLDEQFSHPASSYPTMQLYPTTRDTATCPDNSTCSRDNYSMYLVQNRFFTNALY
ncbi:MAG: hypothetical protein H0T45_01970, partial [Pyrinomonadaceae bacterium]|nr:hypothetical protein [Pyrinomonadaceae bacterium]